MQNFPGNQIRWLFVVYHYLIITILIDGQMCCTPDPEAAAEPGALKAFEKGIFLFLGYISWQLIISM